MEKIKWLQANLQKHRLNNFMIIAAASYFWKPSICRCGLKPRIKYRVFFVVGFAWGMEAASFMEWNGIKDIANGRRWNFSGSGDVNKTRQDYSRRVLVLYRISNYASIVTGFSMYCFNVCKNWAPVAPSIVRWQARDNIMVFLLQFGRF
jgi:hypothetical protein